MPDRPRRAVLLLRHRLSAVAAATGVVAGPDRRRAAGRPGLVPGAASVLHFDRPGGLEVVVNLGSHPIELPSGRSIVLASSPLPDGGRLPGDTAVWLD